MAFNTGLFNTTQNPPKLNTDSFAGQILRRFPSGSAPMFALTSQSGKSKAVSSTHGYFSKMMVFVKQVLAAGVAAGADTITLPSTNGMIEGMVLYNTRTRENVRVLVVISPTVISVTRGFGRVAAAQMNASDNLISVGTAFEEGSNRPIARRMTTVYVPNYTQIFRNAWAVTDTARASMAEQGYNNVTEDRSDCAMLHAVDIESAIIWGQPVMDVSGRTPVHATQGVLDAMEQYCPENTNTASATTNYTQLVGLMEPAYQYSTNLGNAKERVVFCDSQAMKVITDIGRKSGQVQLFNEQTQFGMQYTSFKFYKGVAALIEHPLLNGLGQNGMALVMDMPALKMAYMNGRDLKTQSYGENGKPTDNGVDAVGGDLLTEAAVELINPYACAVIYGLTAGVSDPT